MGHRSGASTGAARDRPGTVPGGRIQDREAGPHAYTRRGASQRTFAGPTMTASPAVRGQTGLDRLLVFLLAVVVLVLVVPHALQAAGIDVREGDRPETVPATDHDLAILAARGEAVGDDGSVGAVRLVVAPNPGRAPVDLDRGSVLWIGDRTVDLAPAGADRAGVDGAYLADGADGPLLETATERGVLRFDLGTDDLAGVGEFGSRLAPGESVDVTLVTEDGETLTRRLTVPDDRSADGTVPL